MTARARSRWSIPVRGPIAEGQCVRIGWPEEAELDAITELRNRSEVRRCFLDQRVLDRDRNREWLRHGMNRPHEALFSIRMKVDDAFIGTLGWSKGDPVARSLELGRVMIDTRRLAGYRDSFPAGYPGVAVDAGRAVIDVAFRTLGLELMRMVVMEGNRLSQRAAVNCGGRVVGTRTERRGDGSELRLIDLECSRENWLHATWRAHYLGEDDIVRLEDEYGRVKA